MSHSLSKEKIQAFFLKGHDVRRVNSIKDVKVLLPEMLIVPPGEYSIYGKSFELHEEGLYRFINATVENRQCIVFQNDVRTLMSAICWLVSHGYRDNRKTFEEKKEIAQRGKLIITCGDCSAFAVQIFRGLKIPARVVNVASLLPRNGYNEGHVLTEIFHEGRWIVFDPDEGAIYYSGEKHLNIMDLVRQVQSDNYRREPLCDGIPVAIGHFTANDYAYDLWYETCLSNHALQSEIFARVMGIPIIAESRINYFTTFSQEDRQRAEELYPERALHFLTNEEFYARFYANENS